MGFINNTSTILNAVLTKKGRQYLAKSDGKFNITKFPDTLTGGKNLFKLKANSNNLVRNSQIHIEVLDYNGNPIYYEPINL